MSYQYDTDDNEIYSKRFLKARMMRKNDRLRSNCDQKSPDNSCQEHTEINDIPNFSKPTNQFYITNGKVYEYHDMESERLNERKNSFNEVTDSCAYHDKILNESSTFKMSNNRSPSNLKQDTIQFGYLHNNTNPSCFKSSSNKIDTVHGNSSRFNNKCSHGTIDSKNMTMVQTTEQSENNCFESPKHIDESDYEFHATPKHESDPKCKYHGDSRSQSKNKEYNDEQPRGSDSILNKYRSNFDSVYERLM